MKLMIEDKGLFEIQPYHFKNAHNFPIREKLSGEAMLSNGMRVTFKEVEGIISNNEFKSSVEGIWDVKCKLK